jgi:hypothetical protein
MLRRLGTHSDGLASAVNLDYGESGVKEARAEMSQANMAVTAECIQRLRIEGKRGDRCGGARRVDGKGVHTRADPGLEKG